MHQNFTYLIDLSDSIHSTDIDLTGCFNAIDSLRFTDFKDIQVAFVTLPPDRQKKNNLQATRATFLGNVKTLLCQQQKGLCEIALPMIWQLGKYSKNKLEIFNGICN